MRKGKDTTPRACCPNSATPGAVKPGMDDSRGRARGARITASGSCEHGRLRKEASHSQIGTLWNVTPCKSFRLDVGRLFESSYSAPARAFKFPLNYTREDMNIRDQQEQMERGS